MDENVVDPVEEIQPNLMEQGMSICNPTQENYQYWAQFWDEVDINSEWLGIIPKVEQPELLRMFQVKSRDAILLALEIQSGLVVPPGLFNPEICQAESLIDKVPRVYWMLMVKDLKVSESQMITPCGEGYTCSSNCIPFSWATQNRNYYYRVLIKEIMCGGLTTISVPMFIYQIPSEAGAQPGEPDFSFLVEIPEYRLANQSPSLVEAIQDTVAQFSSFVEELLVDNGISVATQLGPTAFDPQDIIDLGFVSEADIEALKAVKEKQAVEPLNPIGKAFVRGDVSFDGSPEEEKTN